MASDYYHLFQLFKMKYFHIVFQMKTLKNANQTMCTIEHTGLVSPQKILVPVIIQVAYLS